MGKDNKQYIKRFTKVLHGTTLDTPANIISIYYPKKELNHWQPSMDDRRSACFSGSSYRSSLES